MYSEGTTSRTFDLGVELGGVGFDEYSVNDNELTLRLGVPGLECKPLTFDPFSIAVTTQLMFFRGK